MTRSRFTPGHREPEEEPLTQTQALKLEAALEEAQGAVPVGKSLTQGQMVFKRFRGNSGAIVALVFLLGIVVLAVTSIGIGPVPGWWKYGYTDMSPLVDGGAPTIGLGGLGEHPFGQDTTGRDLFAMTMRGTQTSLFVMVIVGIIAAISGVVVGGVSGYFRGWTEAILMRLTDIVIIVPMLVLTAVLGQMVISRIPAGPGRIVALSVLIGLVAWTGLARLVRGEFLTLREREFVDAARLAGASSRRIIFKHILPNSVGVIIVNVTLLMSAAILIETSLSYLGYGIQAPDWSLGSVINANQSAFSTRPWLFWWPGLFIVAICLCINFIGDGLRDAFDPRQKKFNPRRAKATSAHASE
ncbi:ABC transporter permease [Curtobacterium sp. S6]|uniref:ABC transporter permease n=1 Tax=Curtobacterium sp. S6 TaxID=1479623 RepID=UPI0009E7386B|nr:ABC transporter permease [Curtobacterium sp. S6]